MKKSIQSILVVKCFLFATFCFGQQAAHQDQKAIISWIQENAVPIHYVEAGNGFEDLQPLQEILKDVKVVGLGEATHGTREFFQIKHRLLEFLVKEMGFTGFALEAPYFACQPINDYILSGKGDLSSVLTGQGYVVWDTEEMVEMIKWMRTYNQNVPEERLVKFYGLDLAYQETDLWKGPKMGYQLREKFGNEYYAFGLEVNQGSYQTRTGLSPNLLGDLKSITIPPAPMGSWPWYLSQSNVGNLLLDFRGAHYPAEVEEWINSPQEIFLTGWVHDPKRTYLEQEIGRLYDGIIYIHSTSPTTPTTNALNNADAGKGL